MREEKEMQWHQEFPIISKTRTENQQSTAKTKQESGNHSNQRFPISSTKQTEFEFILSATKHNPDQEMAQNQLSNSNKDSKQAFNQIPVDPIKGIWQHNLKPYLSLKLLNLANQAISRTCGGCTEFLHWRKRSYAKSGN